MKKAFILVSVLLLNFHSTSAQPLQSSQVPSIIRDSLRGRFSEVPGLSWAKAGAGYKASFTNRNGADTEVTYDANGKWNKIVLQGRIPDSLLRVQVRTTFNTVSQGGQVVSRSRVMTRGASPINIITVDKLGKKTTYEIDDNGKILKQN